MDELPDLVADRLHHARRTVPQEVTAPAREEVEIGVAVGIGTEIVMQEPDRIRSPGARHPVSIS